MRRLSWAGQLKQVVARPASWCRPASLMARWPAGSLASCWTRHPVGAFIVAVCPPGPCLGPRRNTLPKCYPYTTYGYFFLIFVSIVMSRPPSPLHPSSSSLFLHRVWFIPSTQSLTYLPETLNPGTGGLAPLSQIWPPVPACRICYESIAAQPLQRCHVVRLSMGKAAIFSLLSMMHATIQLTPSLP